MTQDGVVETETVLNFSERFVAAFDIEKHVVSLDELFDRVSELATAPVFDAVDLTALFGDERVKFLRLFFVVEGTSIKLSSKDADEHSQRDTRRRQPTR